MKIVLAKLFLAPALIFSFSVAPISAASKTLATTYVGNDVSYPQCGKTLPTKPSFGVVGVNNGLANGTNTCLVKQLAWAAGATGQTIQPKVQLYLNTANPGGLNTPSWPIDNSDPSGNITDNPYGNCDGSNSLACSYQYGWDRAVEDAQQRLPSAAAQAGIDSNSANYTWWLDVETINTWQSGDLDATSKNAADLEGMAAYLQSIGATVGLYSTTYQWGQIAGPAKEASSLNGLINWRPGARNFNSAKTNCSLAPLTPGGSVTITQYISSNLDYDYACGS